MFLFLVFINMTGFHESEVQRKVGEIITKPLVERKPLERAHMKFIDDLSFVHGLNLKNSLKKHSAVIPRPVQYHNRTGHFLPESETFYKIKPLNLISMLRARK